MTPPRSSEHLADLRHTLWVDRSHLSCIAVTHNKDRTTPGSPAAGQTTRSSSTRCLEVVGDWWSLLIVGGAFPRAGRSDDFQERLRISRSVLNQRLAHLVEAGVLVKVPYSERPPRHD